MAVSLHSGSVLKNGRISLVERLKMAAAENRLVCVYVKGEEYGEDDCEADGTLKEVGSDYIGVQDDEDRILLPLADILRIEVSKDVADDDDEEDDQGA